jgi:hypothetical protein
LFVESLCSPKTRRRSSSILKSFCKQQFSDPLCCQKTSKTSKERKSDFAEEKKVESKFYQITFSLRPRETSLCFGNKVYIQFVLKFTQEFG